jgi:hypothetical protein
MADENKEETTVAEEGGTPPEPQKSEAAPVAAEVKAAAAAGAETGGNNDTPKTDAPTASFSDKLYEQITSVIGGTNSNQFFCMGLPGTLIDASQYSYDVDNNQPKPSHVKANESKLVNKLFDACKMTSSDNGRHLQTQYRTALDALTPKLNGQLFKAKNQLRQVMMTPYPYNFGGGDKDVLTIGQVFYRLYNDYVTAKQAWAQKQQDKKDSLAKIHPGQTVEDYKKRDDEFLDWYGITAEAETLFVEEKLGKVLGVFSPGDMDIITGILDSGTGRELAEARNALANVQEMNPDGGFVYPVTLYPENWFTLLDTSFNPTDLLESPAALAQQLSVLIAQRSNLTTNINTFLDVIPSDATVATLKTAYTASDTAFKAAAAEAAKTYSTSTIDMVKTLVDVMASDGKKKASDVPASTAVRIFSGIDPEQVGTLLTALDTSITACATAQTALVDAANKATTAAMEYFQTKNLLQYKTMLTPLKQQLEDTNSAIAALQSKIKLASVFQPKAVDGKPAYDKADESAVTPNHVPENFTQIIITSSMAEANQQSSSQSNSSSSTFGCSFFFGGYSSSRSHSDTVNKAFSDKTDMTIQIGMSVAKVQIDREWFNPGVFMLTKDMYNTSSTPIAPRKTYTEFTDARFKEMNESLFPCFPTSFVIARDVTIKFTMAEAMSSSFAQSVEDHSASGGGFFIFSGSSSSASSSSSSNAHSSSTANSVTVRFTNPQILGYYLEATPTDYSVNISEGATHSNDDFITIFEFITAFQQMLNDHNQKYKPTEQWK